MRDAEPVRGLEPANHPLAIRMGVIAGLSHNIIIGTIFGSFGVLVQSLERRLNASPEMVSVGIPLVVVGSSLFASGAGALAARYSLRSLMATGAAMATAAWLIMAFTTSYLAYVAAYALLLGPAMALAGSVLPPTLVTRWFSRNRGLALGLVHLPILVAIMPVLANFVLEREGARTVYLMLAALTGLILLPATFLVIEHPPTALRSEPDKAADGADALPTDGGAALTIPQLLASSRFWAFAIVVGAINTSSVILGSYLVPMATTWGFDRTAAALLASIMALAGIAGSVLFGWVTDRIGGGRTLALLAMNAGLLWLLLLLQLPYAALAAVVALVGLHGAGAIPALSRGLAEALGPATFSRAFGLATTLSLPLTVIGVMGTAGVYQRVGSYLPAILAMVCYFAIAVPVGLYAGGRTKQP